MNKNLITLALGLSLTACGGDSVETTAIENINLESLQESIAQRVNTPATFAGTREATISESTTTASGTIEVLDGDDDENSVVEQTDTQLAFGLFSITSDGMWTYTLDTTNETVMALVGGEQTTDTALISSADGSISSVSINIAGDSSGATVAGVTSGSVNTISATTTTGIATADDPDVGESLFIAETVTTEYGSLSILENGEWTYTFDTANQEAIDVIAAAYPETFMDTAEVTTFDGSTGSINIEIELFNIAANITGELSATSNNISTATLSGTAAVTDSDNGHESFQVQEDVETDYGTISISAEGDWTYVLDNENVDVVALNTVKDKLTDNILINSFDGSEQIIAITITGTISGDLSTNLANNEISANGAIEVESYEAADAKVTPATDQLSSSSYGTYSITDLGAWTYTLDDPLDAEVAALTGEDTLMDSFTVMAEDGNTTTVDITIKAENLDGIPLAEDFEFYSVDDDIGDTKRWNSYNTNGTTLIADVSDAQAKDGTKSLYLHDGDASNKPFAALPFTEGASETGAVYFSIYIPSTNTKTSYVHIGDGKNNSDRFFELRFSGSGTVQYESGDPDTTIGSVSTDEWQDVELSWEPDGADYDITVKLNGVTTGTYSQSLSGLDNTQTPSQLTFYTGDTGGADNSVYFDAIGGKLFEPLEDFESVDHVVGEDISTLDAWNSYNTDGVDLIADVSDTQALSGTKSLYLHDGSASNKPFAAIPFKEATETGSVSFNIYIPSTNGKTSYVHIGDGKNNSDRFFELRFSGSGTVQFESGDPDTTIGSVSTDEWQEVELSWEPDGADFDVTVSLNGTVVGTYKQSLSGLDNTQTPSQLTFYTGDTGGADNSVYFDDIRSFLFDL